MVSEQRPAGGIVIRDARIFDGMSGGVRAGHVLIEGTKIRQVGDPPVPAGATVIDAGGRTLVPGLGDAHA